jgi:hypothetical protein
MTQLPVFFNEVTLNEIKNQIKPLDLICFRGNEFVSNTISKVQKLAFGNGDWTHVGIIITADLLNFKNSNPNKLYIWESTMSGSLGDGVNNIETDKGFFGVQIRDFEKVINKYIKDDITKIGWCKLLNNPYELKNNEPLDEYRKRLNIIKLILQNFYNKYGKSKYDYKILTMFKTIFPFINKIKFLKKLFHTNNMFFCSELVATIYKEIHILDESIDPESIAPIELLGYTNDNLGKIVNEPIIICKSKILH